MKIVKTNITVRELVNGYINDPEHEELGVYAYGGKLCVRPSFQRSFVYERKEENAVIDTALKGFPLNIMYWSDNGDGTYDCMDGQQRTISLCKFAAGDSHFTAKWLNDNKKTYITNLARNNPTLLNSFYDYVLDVYICYGDKAERMEWFKTINIAGQPLYPQELRNVNYVSPWLTDAKRYFSKASDTSHCPAESVGGQYTNKIAKRQEILEQVLIWACGSDKDEDICNYMEAHVNDADASELWQYFNDVIEWVKNIFPGTYDKGMSSVNWGRLYNEYKDKEFDPDEMDNKFNELMDYKASKELDISVAKICEYCITRDESLLKHRSFNEVQRLSLYNRQKGICPDCGKHFTKNEMHAHHIVPWYSGGVTELTNGVMLCKNCHTARHANS